MVGERGAPKALLCDNGPEFVSRSLDLWAYVNKVRILLAPGPHNYLRGARQIDHGQRMFKESRAG